MFLHIIEVKPLGEYQLKLWFNNGTVKEIDLREELYGEIFEPLKDLQIFQQVEVNQETQTIEWPNGADFAPEFLFEKGQEVKVT